MLALAALASVAACQSLAPSTQQSQPPLTWGDQGDGTYKNPVLKSDYSDPDIVRVGQDFYLIASDFHFVGMQVLHSRDLVNWEIIGPEITGNDVYLRGINENDTGRLLYSLDGKTFADTNTPFRLTFRNWKGSRIALFSYGPNGGAADFDYVHYSVGSSK